MPRKSRRTLQRPASKPRVPRSDPCSFPNVIEQPTVSAGSLARCCFGCWRLRHRLDARVSSSENGRIRMCPRRSSRRLAIRVGGSTPFRSNLLPYHGLQIPTTKTSRPRRRMIQRLRRCLRCRSGPTTDSWFPPREPATSNCSNGGRRSGTPIQAQPVGPPLRPAPPIAVKRRRPGRVSRHHR